LWPESFPHKNETKIKITIKLISYISEYIRNIAISKSHYVITESNYFYKYLNLNKYKSKSKIIYLKKFSGTKRTGDKLSNILSIVYLGNIGAIYDFESLIKIIYEVNKKREVNLHIVGGGPKIKYLLNELNKYKIQYINHGVTFDENIKGKILTNCWFGFNGYEKTTQVALSYKFIDYMSFGLPVINYSKEDTYNFVEKNIVGINYDPLDLTKSILYLTNIKKNEILSLKNNAHKLFESKFSGKSYLNEMNELVGELNSIKA
jgi:glycosyltransferase involved in cell wall biosynthesis